MDCKDKLVSEFERGMVSLGYGPDEIHRVTRMLLPKLDQYKVEPQTTEITVYDSSADRLIRNYLATILTEGKSQKTAYSYYRLLTRFSIAVGKPLTEVTTFDVRLWLADQEGRVALVTCDGYRACLSAFYSWLDAEDLIAKNPMSKVKPIKYERKVQLPFTIVELDLLRRACETPRQKALVEFLVSTGARVSEVAAVNISDIDFNTNKVVIRVGKGNKQRTVFMSDVCKEYLKRYLLFRTDNLDALFVTKLKSRATKGAIQQELKLIGAVAGVSDVHPHKFRRTFATTLAKRGMAIQEIQQLMGHTNVNTTMRYIHLDDAQVEYSYKKCS